MDQKCKTIQILNSLEIKKILLDEERAFLIDKKEELETGIKEEYPKSYELLSKLGKVDHYLYPKTALYNKIESDLLVKGYRNTIPQEIALNETINSIKSDLKKLEKTINEERIQDDILFIQYYEIPNFIEKDSEVNYMLEDEKYNMDKNAIIISDSE